MESATGNRVDGLEVGSFNWKRVFQPATIDHDQKEDLVTRNQPVKAVAAKNK